MSEVKSRDFSIDVIKFIAVIFIINSHADICYARYSALATGGAIGDAMFLFCSGYTLFWGSIVRFDNWYKRRVSRIYPSVFSCLAVALVIEGNGFASLTLARLGGGEFVIAIMIYYVLLYAVQKWLLDRIPWAMAFTVVATLVAYWYFPYKYEVSNNGLYGITTYFRWVPYFAIMLMGAWVGMKVKKGDVHVKTTWKDPALMLLCLFVFYGVQLCAKRYPIVAPWQIITIPFLAGIVYYFWRCCHASFFARMYAHKVGNWFVMAIGGVCLESYLIQFSLFTDKLNWMFPLNIPVLMVFILLVSYLCRCLARVFTQTFGNNEYDWKKVFSVK